MSLEFGNVRNTYSLVGITGYDRGFEGGISNHQIAQNK